MFIEFVKTVNTFNSFILGWSNELIEKLPISEIIKDALIDSINLVPFLFVIFFFMKYIFQRKSNGYQTAQE